MKLGIMQPYFFPYIGYWQLMNTVDKYVIYDDVNFIKQGWINRNRILANGKVQYINLPMLGASSNKLINQVGVNNSPQLLAKIMRTVEMAYSKAPFFNEVYPILEKCIYCSKDNVADYIAESFYLIGEYMGIKTEFIFSSSLQKDCTLRGQEKVLHICDLLHAEEYYNAIGGKELYQSERFSERGIKLNFLRTKEIEYPQFGNEFVPGLSIIDVMMFNSVEKIQKLLTEFEVEYN